MLLNLEGGIEKMGQTAPFNEYTMVLNKHRDSENLSSAPYHLKEVDRV
jgi:hypothetical protein